MGRKRTLAAENKNIYKRYQNIKKRCYNEKCNSYKIMEKEELKYVGSG